MELPNTLIMDILSRVPPKALLRFRCVSKSWKDLIDDSYFINLHLQQSLKNTTNLSLIVRSSYIYSVDFPALTKSIVIDHHLKRDDRLTMLLGSCNGLLCLMNGQIPGKNDTIIYNPVTRKCREVPASKIEFPAGVRSYYELPIVYGFGYDLINDDYKVVRIIPFYYEIPRSYLNIHEVKVFSLKANSWRRVQDFPYHFNYNRDESVYVSGHLHWLVILKPASEVSRTIVAFDLGCEVYKDVLLPKYPAGEACLRVEVLQQCLCLLIDYAAIRSDVWVMKEYGVEDSWTKLFQVAQENIGRFNCVRPIAFSKDGSKVLLEQDFIKCIWYDVYKKNTERVNITDMPSRSRATLLVESLVLGSHNTNWKKMRLPF